MTRRDAICIQGKNICIFDSEFYGDNDPWDGQYVQNNNGALYLPYGNETYSAHIRGCTFRNLYGHPIHGQGIEVVIEDSLFQNCSNGPNVNCDRAVYRRLTLIDAEGIETSDNYSTVEYCDLIRGTLAIGGHQSTMQYGHYAHDCTIDNEGAEGIAQIGFILTDNTSGAILENMTARNCDVGFVVGGQSGLPVLNATARGFAITNARIGMYIAASTIEIVIPDGEVSGCFRGADIRAGEVELIGYHFTGNTTDIYIANTVDHVLIRNCTYDSITIEDGANVTIE